MNNELHRSVIVIKEQDTVEAGSLGLRLSARNHNGTVFRTIPAIGLALHDCIEMPHDTCNPNAHLSGPACPIM